MSGLERKAPRTRRGFEPVEGPAFNMQQRVICNVFSRLSLVPCEQRVARHEHRRIR